MNKKKFHISTRAVQSGYEPKNAEPRVPSIVQSTTYKFDTAEQIGDVFEMKDKAHIYSRLSNPTVQALEEKIKILENGTAAVAFSSGQAAITTAILNLCNSGDHFISAQSLYGGTIGLFSTLFKKFNIEVTYIDQDAPIEEIQKEIKPNTKLVYAETLTNPGNEVLDFEKFSKLAQQNKVPLVIDNTFPTPILCRPFEHGANIVIHSTTKYIDGHATSLGGIIVEGGNFDWGNGNFPDFVEPDPGVNNVSYWNDYKNTAFVVKARKQLLGNLGPCMAPFNAFLTFHGCQTLALRMPKHSENALTLAKFLENHEKIEWVKYAGLPSNKYFELSKKYLPDGASGVLAFAYKGNAEETKAFTNRLQLISLVVHVGDIRTCVVHPASMTHKQLSEQQMKDINITPSLIRLSVGIEDVNDLIDDFKQALK